MRALSRRRSRCEFSDEAEVVEDVEAPALCRQHEIRIADVVVDQEIGDRCARQVELELLPGLGAVERSVEPELGAGEDESVGAGVLARDPHEVALGQAGGLQVPARTAIVGSEDVGGVVVQR